jgi:hypothetical protein
MSKHPVAFQPDLCSVLASILTAVPSGPNMGRVLDDDWAFVSCAFSDETRTEIVVTLRAADCPDSMRDPDLFDTHVVIALKDLDLGYGRAMHLSVVQLVLELFLIFTSQAGPSEVAGIIRLPGWSPVL